jgi:hypothetical protein
MFRALVETRLLSERASKTRNAIHLIPKGHEAAWVGPLIDLKPGDLTSLPRANWLATHIRSVGARPTASAASTRDLRNALAAFTAEKSTRSTIPPIDRLLCSVGMAIALKSTSPQSVVTAYASAGDLSASEWKHVLEVASEGDLPLILVATPDPKPVDISTVVKRMGLKTIPVIPVDAADAVALYRVAQETLVRARADGGVAVIECIDCGSDPITILGKQLVAKRICTPHWVTSVATHLRTKL